MRFKIKSPGWVLFQDEGNQIRTWLKSELRTGLRLLSTEASEERCMELPPAVVCWLWWAHLSAAWFSHRLARVSGTLRKAVYTCVRRVCPAGWRACVSGTLQRLAHRAVPRTGVYVAYVLPSRSSLMGPMGDSKRWTVRLWGGNSFPCEALLCMNS